MRAVFTGFDSAWGASNTGAICELVLQDDGSLLLQKDQPVSANWNNAIDRVGRKADATLDIWAIDQPICVANESGCRPVEADLAEALMGDFGCGAHSSNLSNPCWTASARIWDLLRTLAANGYRHSPMAIPAEDRGRHYFECYPHPAIVGLFDLDHILKYKVRHRDGSAWQQMVRLLQSLASADLPITNIGSFVTEWLAQNQDNENKLDAIICAYVAAYWWKYGTERSTMIGDTTTGYIVTPHSCRTRLALAAMFRGRLNMQGEACAPPHAGQHPVLAPLPTKERPPAPPALVADRLPPEPPTNWIGPVALRATDTTNLWRTSMRAVINPWMNVNRMVHWHLWIRFLEEDGEPAVLFVPFENQGQQQGGMRSAIQQMNRHLWHALVAEASRDNPIDFQILYRYQPI
jgi:predicted RNase H-like nuclease